MSSYEKCFCTLFTRLTGTKVQILTQKTHSGARQEVVWKRGRRDPSIDQDFQGEKRVLHITKSYLISDLVEDLQVTLGRDFVNEATG